MSSIYQRYQFAKELYAEYGIDTDAVLEKLNTIPVSIHCWQIDDLTGFEDFDSVLTGGIAVTGSNAGKPRSKEEYVEHLTAALKLIPGANRVALHAIYLYDRPGARTERNEITPDLFAPWIDYAKEMQIGLDFNPTYFKHPLADSGFTLSSPDPAIREFWIEHGIRSRKIGGFFGTSLGTPCVTNHWIPDGYKDFTADQLSPRLRLIESLDRLFAEPVAGNIDSVESKLFGLGSESYVTGSHEFYTNYCALHDSCIICMDLGHYHPTEKVSDKLSAYLAFGREIMLHVSRGVRWDSDHVVVLDDEVRAVMREIARADAFDKVHIGTDYFDGSIDRITATVIGSRSVKKALLYALLEPTKRLRELEDAGNFGDRLAMMEMQKTLPFGAVWDQFCESWNMPGENWFMR